MAKQKEEEEETPPPTPKRRVPAVPAFRPWSEVFRAVFRRSRKPPSNLPHPIARAAEARGATPKKGTVRKKPRDIDLRREVERSRELEEMLSWIETPTLVSVDFVVRCLPGVDAGAQLEISYRLSTPSMHVSIETGRKSIRDELIQWACADEDGVNLISGLARTLGVDRDDVEVQVKQLLGERLPESIEGLHDEALQMVAVNGETDFATALVARVLLARAGVTDEAVQALLDYRCAATVMGS